MVDSTFMRVRIFFSKNEAMRFTGHLDLHKTWERVFRRAGLPLAYTQGFHPQPKLNLACALPLGFTSHAEILDAWLENSMGLQEVQVELERSVPPGITISRVETIDPKAPALQTQVSSSEYIITFLTSVPNLEQKLAEVIAAPSIIRQRRERTYDLRPLIECLHCLPNTEEGFACIGARLAAREGATGRPEELVQTLGGNPALTRVHRSRLIFIEQEEGNSVVKLSI
jgi:radical SAM-linked protein